MVTSPILTISNLPLAKVRTSSGVSKRLRVTSSISFVPSPFDGLLSFSQFSFPLCRVLPPRLLWPAFHVSDSSNERIQKARVVALAGDAAQVVVHFVWVTANEIVGLGKPQLAKIGGDG